MVKEVTYFMDEITGRAYKYYAVASKKEQESRLKIESQEAERYAENLASSYGFSNFRLLSSYLVENIDSIRNAGVKARIKALQNRGISSFSLQDVKDSLKYLVDLAMSDIKGSPINIKIYLDGREVNSYNVNKSEFDETKVELEGYNPTVHYLDNIQKGEETYSYYYLQYPCKSISKEDIVSLLEDFNIQYCDRYMSILKSSLGSNLSREDIYIALESAGVDNWDGYDFARELADEDNQDWFALSPEERLGYLESAGVDNWSYYSDALDDMFDYTSLSNEEKYDLFIENEDFLAKNWSNYTEFKKKLLL